VLEALQIFIIGCQYEQHIQVYKQGEEMTKINNNKQLTTNKQHILGSREEQPLLFLLVHLILC